VQPFRLPSGTNPNLLLRNQGFALARAFMNAALPSVGLVPDEAEEIPTDGEKYELKLTRAHTGERIDVVYRIGNTYIPEALAQLNDFLRDSRTQEAVRFDPREFDLLHTVLMKLGKSKTSSIFSLGTGRKKPTTKYVKAALEMPRSTRSTFWRKPSISVYRASPQSW
jgi:uncharacterized protein YcbK (DUF882 family)